MHYGQLRTMAALGQEELVRCANDINSDSTHTADGMGKGKFSCVLSDDDLRNPDIILCDIGNK